MGRISAPLDPDLEVPSDPLSEEALDRYLVSLQEARVSRANKDLAGLVRPRINDLRDDLDSGDIVAAQRSLGGLVNLLEEYLECIFGE